MSRGNQEELRSFELVPGVSKLYKHLDIHNCLMCRVNEAPLSGSSRAHSILMGKCSYARISAPCWVSFSSSEKKDPLTSKVIVRACPCYNMDARMREIQ